MSVTRTTPPERRTQQGSTAGVIETISDAVTFVIQRPWMMIVPLFVDVVLWLVLHVSMGPVIDNLIRLLESSDVQNADLVIDELRATGDQVMISDYLGAFVPGLFTGIPLDSLMGALMLFIAPDGFGVPRTDMYQPWAYGFVDVISPDSAGAVFGTWLLAILGSSIALVLFRVPMARAIRATRPTSLTQELASGWMHFLLYFLLLVAVTMAALIPIAILGAILSILGLSLAFVFAIALLVLGTMAGVYTLFAVDAMLIHRTSPINGFRMSYAVGRMYFGQVARFAMTSIFIMLATLSLWSALASTAPGFIISLLGSAFVGTVLAAASMFFYTDRYRIIRALELGDRRRSVSPTRLDAGTRKE